MSARALFPGYLTKPGQDAYITTRRYKGLVSRVKSLERHELALEDRLKSLEARPRRKRKASPP